MAGIVGRTGPRDRAGSLRAQRSNPFRRTARPAHGLDPGVRVHPAPILRDDGRFWRSPGTAGWLLLSGWVWLRCLVVTARGWSEAKKRARVIADNKLTLNAGWDYGMLSLELSDSPGPGHRHGPARLQ
ncbi:MAG: hypothetical protein MZV64_10390 [Ignavibacteriales bacterium]|nr:hypothetical protein [Ignavibacteriales bacterium]